MGAEEWVLVSLLIHVPIVVAWIALVGLVRVFGWGSDAESPVVAPPSDDIAYYYKHWCNNSDLHGSGMQFLDDTLCQKIFPRNSDRDLTCEGIPTQLQDMPSGYTDVLTLGDTHSLPNVTLRLPYLWQPITLHRHELQEYC